MPDEETASDSTMLERRAASAELGAALRAVIVAENANETALDDLREATELARRLETLLGGRERPLTELASIDDIAHGIRNFSPVTGVANPMSPPLVFEGTDVGVVSRATLDRRFEGPPGHVHGGITGLMLDEVLGQAGTRAGRWGMTAFLNITYRRALPLDVELEFTSWITSIDGRKTHVSGAIALASDPTNHFVEATALFVEPRAETQEQYFGDLTDVVGVPQSGRHGSPYA